MSKSSDKLSKNIEQTFSQIWKPEAMVSAVRNGISMGQKDFVVQVIDRINTLVYGGDLMQAAVYFDQPEIVELLLLKGISLDEEPDSISKVYGSADAQAEAYRKTPFIVLAASRGNRRVFEYLVRLGRDPNEEGFIGFSKKRKNQVISNCIGAAAFNGHLDFLKFLLCSYPHDGINCEAREKTDKPKANLIKEFTGYTPILLSIVGDHDHTVRIIKELKGFGADIRKTDFNKNTALHVAIKYDNNPATKYLLAETTLNVFGRNANGDSLISIATSNNNVEIEQLLKRYGDNSQQKTESLLRDMQEEEEKIRKKQQKKLEKKKRQKNKKGTNLEGSEEAKTSSKSSIDNESEDTNQVEPVNEKEEKLEESKVEEKKQEETSKQSANNELGGFVIVKIPSSTKPMQPLFKRPQGIIESSDEEEKGNSQQYGPSKQTRKVINQGQKPRPKNDTQKQNSVIEAQKPKREAEHKKEKDLIGSQKNQINGNIQKPVAEEAVPKANSSSTIEINVAPTEPPKPVKERVPKKPKEASKNPKQAAGYQKPPVQEEAQNPLYDKKLEEYKKENDHTSPEISQLRNEESPISVEPLHEMSSNWERVVKQKDSEILELKNQISQLTKELETAKSTQSSKQIAEQQPLQSANNAELERLQKANTSLISDLLNLEYQFSVEKKKRGEAEESLFKNFEKRMQYDYIEAGEENKDDEKKGQFVVTKDIKDLMDLANHELRKRSRELVQLRKTRDQDSQDQPGNHKQE